MNIAIFSPNQQVYSETFISAHKKYLKDNVYYYSGSIWDIKLDGKFLLRLKKRNRFLFLLKRLIKKTNSDSKNQILLDSLRKNKIDVILVEYGTHANHLLPFLKQVQIPFIVHFHGYDASVQAEIDACKNYFEVFNYASKIVVVSKKMESMLLGIGCPIEKIVYNVYGPHPEFEIVIPKFSKQQFLGIGRFVDKKAPYYTIMAFKKIIKQYPEAKLVLAGDGVLLNMCQNLVKQYKLEHNVQFIGVITPKLFRDLLSESLALVQHSITASNGDMEGTPLAVLEASAAGLPVIATNHAGIPDVIIHGETGLLSDEHDVEKMALNMLKVLDNLDYAILMGSNGKNNIMNNFTLNMHISKLQSTLGSLIIN